MTPGGALGVVDEEDADERDVVHPVAWRGYPRAGPDSHKAARGWLWGWGGGPTPCLVYAMAPRSGGDRWQWIRVL